jgi:hypothetical protein
MKLTFFIKMKQIEGTDIHEDISGEESEESSLTPSSHETPRTPHFRLDDYISNTYVYF